MRILITNAHLNIYAGTQVVVKELAFELRRQGHEPLVYSPRLGQVAAELENAGIEVSDQLASFSSAPDVIHGQHYPVVEALLRFPTTPAVYVCHSSIPWPLEMLSYFPRILRYVAVDDSCRSRLETVARIPPARVQVFLNAVDLERFRQRAPLPSRPKRALVFSNNASGVTYLPAVRKACRQAGLQLDVVGLSARNAVSNPEALLPQYDIVFAKARCALEAMAVGNAVVLCDARGLGPMVSLENFDNLRPMNFGYTQLVNPVRADLIRGQIERYDPDDATAVCQRIRREAGLTEATRRWVALYTEVIEEFRRSERNLDRELRAFADYWVQWSRNYTNRVDWEAEQIRKVKSIPLVGGVLTHLARRVFNRWFGGHQRW